MQRRTLLKAFALSASVMAMGLSFQAYAADTIKVGIMHSLSGTMAISETPLKDVALMAIDDINAKGGVLGKKLEPVVVDPASNWPLFAEKARQLLAQDKVAVVFGCWTSVSRKSVLPVFEELNGLLFYPVQYEGEEMSPNVFYTGAAPNQQAIPAVEYLLSEDGGGAKRFFLLGTDYVYPRTTNKILRAFLHAKGIQDKDIEENYHAQFMEQALQQAGFETRILRGLDELGWDAAGQLIDGEGRLVNCVWKTWAWETAFDQIREVSDREFAAVPIRTGHPQNEVRLIDVLLRPEVLVFEPLWTVIPGNKAILPILWSLFPHHRYLLDTDFTVNDELVKTGYAVKPIAGRCGSNIDLVSHHEEVLDQTSGKFAEQKNIYQQLWCLPKVDGKYIQVCTFTVGGNYGGTCLRGDESLVIKKESDIEPLIVVKE